MMQLRYQKILLNKLEIIINYFEIIYFLFSTIILLYKNVYLRYTPVNKGFIYATLQKTPCKLCPGA